MMNRRSEPLPKPIAKFRTPSGLRVVIDLHAMVYVNDLALGHLPDGRITGELDSETDDPRFFEMTLQIPAAGKQCDA